MNFQHKAKKIALDLYTGGKDMEIADTIQLYRRDGLYLGSWSLKGLEERILAHLNGELEKEDNELHQLNEDEFLKEHP